jgi:hypothetical protein
LDESPSINQRHACPLPLSTTNLTHKSVSNNCDSSLRHGLHESEPH